MDYHLVCALNLSPTCADLLLFTSRLIVVACLVELVRSIYFHCNPHTDITFPSQGELLARWVLAASSASRMQAQILANREAVLRILENAGA